MPADGVRFPVRRQPDGRRSFAGAAAGFGRRRRGGLVVGGERFDLGIEVRRLDLFARLLAQRRPRRPRGSKSLHQRGFGGLRRHHGGIAGRQGHDSGAVRMVFLDQVVP